MNANLDSAVPSQDELEQLFVNNPALEKIRNYLGRFNPIKTMGMERMEIRHSAILGWLLNPQETHGLGDAFLKAFLAQALRGQGGDNWPGAIAVSQADLMDAEVRRERSHIDLLVLSQRNGWAFVIENKFDSRQKDGQLKRYMDGAEGFLKFIPVIRGIFLTLWQEEPGDERYVSIDYATICDLLNQVALSGRASLSREVEVFLRHYLDVILEATGMSDEQVEMEELARQLYRGHRRVLDFILTHGKRTGFEEACEMLFPSGLKQGNSVEIGDQRFIRFNSDSAKLSFFPQEWHNVLEQRDFSREGCEKWWAGLPLIMWVHLMDGSKPDEGQLRLFAAVGPLSNQGFRRRLIDAIKGAASKDKKLRIKFQNGASDEGKKTSTFVSKISIPVDCVYDHEQIANAIKEALMSCKPEVEAISEVLKQFLDQETKASSE